MSEMVRFYRCSSFLHNMRAFSVAKLMVTLENSSATFKRDIGRLRDQLHVQLLPGLLGK
jgi:predicted DNA-binding transcriptional regulator YafY